MRTHYEECTASSKSNPDFMDMTDEIERVVAESGIRRGQVTVFANDPGCVLIVNERESGLLTDIKEALRRLGIDRPAARKTMIGSTSVVMPAVDGKLKLGTWQRILLVELEDAGPRSISVTLVGE
jgi:secondary thiamine-phosphate synthase enzyme